MTELNYHHLRYFWAVAREGSVAAACRRLHVAQPTVSGQLRELERTLGGALFERHGRRLALTDLGRLALGYCDGIFALGRELAEAVAGREAGRPTAVAAGVVEEVPKLVARRLLAPILALGDQVRLSVSEDRRDRLLAALATHDLDLVISDAPWDGRGPMQAASHLLGESGLAIYAAPALARRLRRGFPGSLDGAQFLLFHHGSPARRAVLDWLDGRSIRPRVVAEFEDSALMKSFAEDGTGAFPAPRVIAAEMTRQYGVVEVGPIPGVRERWYAIALERRLGNPAMRAVLAAARGGLAG
jgi:LysR family transcriptional activator of nhaA